MNRTAVFVLGAGFSAPFGIPTMKPFLQSFKETASRKYPKLCGTLTKHFERLSDESDIEALLSSLGSAESLRISMPPGSDISHELVAWETESRILKAHLVSYIIERCERFDQDAAVQYLAELLEGLVVTEEIDTVCFATTNYDRIIEYVSNAVGLDLSDGFGGGDNSVTAPWTGEFVGSLHLYKLHGSVTYYGDREAKGSERYFRLDRGYPLPSPDFRLTRDGNALEPMMVLPTLEKETLDDPYGQLNHRFAEMMSRSKIVVAIGTSLRDNDLVSALNYSGRNSVLLLVDTEPSVARNRIANLTCVTLRASGKDFLAVSTKRLIRLLSECSEEDEHGAIVRKVEDFADKEIRALSQWASLSDDQRLALSVVQRASGESNTMKSIQLLRGLADAGVVEAVSKLCKTSESPLIRKAAAGCLGLSGSRLAVAALSECAVNDPSPDVRLEGYLALVELGGEEVQGVLDAAKKKWPEDSFFC